MSSNTGAEACTDGVTWTAAALAVANGHAKLVAAMQ